MNKLSLLGAVTLTALFAGAAPAVASIGDGTSNTLQVAEFAAGSHGNPAALSLNLAKITPSG